ncbi:MAG: MIP/aquaporin family protein [Gemmatimonadales bacterium]
MRNYLTEFIGTFFLVLTIGLTVLDGTPFAPLAIGASLMIMVYMGGHVSGAHYNPAVSLAVLLRGKMASTGEFAGYVISQIAGATAAALVTYLIVGRTFAPAPAAGASAVAPLLVEFLYTFALGLVVLNSAASAKTHGNSFYGLAIGFTIVVGAFAGGPLSGGAFNPAVGIGPILVNALLGGGTWAHLWLYLVGPLAGGALAAVVFGLQEREPIQLHAEPSRVPESRPA